MKKYELSKSVKKIKGSGGFCRHTFFDTKGVLKTTYTTENYFVTTGVMKQKTK